MTEDDIEKEIIDKGLTAPRLTPGDIDRVIVSDEYYVFPDTTTTVCCLTLRNSHTVIGSSACVSKENFDAEVGRKVARENARRKIWELEGYLLQQKLSDRNLNCGADRKQ